MDNSASLNHKDTLFRHLRPNTFLNKKWDSWQHKNHTFSKKIQ